MDLIVFYKIGCTLLTNFFGRQQPLQLPPCATTTTFVCRRHCCCCRQQHNNCHSISLNVLPSLFLAGGIGGGGGSGEGVM
jgi:hypothetical protein